MADNKGSGLVNIVPTQCRQAKATIREASPLSASSEATAFKPFLSVMVCMEFCADSFGHGNDYTPESEGWQVPLRMGLYATLNEVRAGTRIKKEVA